MILSSILLKIKFLTIPRCFFWVLKSYFVLSYTVVWAGLRWVVPFVGDRVLSGTLSSISLWAWLLNSYECTYYIHVFTFYMAICNTRNISTACCALSVFLNKIFQSSPFQFHSPFQDFQFLISSVLFRLLLHSQGSPGLLSVPASVSCFLNSKRCSQSCKVKHYTCSLVLPSCSRITELCNRLWDSSVIPGSSTLF